MADSKSSPRSSPNSRPIFFMKRATLAGLFSSRSPKLGDSARASSRASSDFTVAKRDIRRDRAEPPQTGHTGEAAADGRSTRRLTRLRQSPHADRAGLARRLAALERQLATRAAGLASPSAFFTSGDPGQRGP